MGLLKQIINEMDPNMGPYGGIVGLDQVDKLKNDPKKVALPFTRYLTQRSSAEGEEETGEDKVPIFSQNPKVEELLHKMYSAGSKESAVLLYNAVKSGISLEDFQEALLHYYMTK